MMNSSITIMMWFTIFLVVLFAVPDVKSDGDWYDYNYPGSLDPVTYQLGGVLAPTTGVLGDTLQPLNGKKPLNGLLSNLNKPTGGVLNPVTDQLGGVLDPVTGGLGGVLDPVTGGLGGVLDPVTGGLGGVLDPVTGGLGDTLQSLNDPNTDDDCDEFNTDDGYNSDGQNNNDDLNNIGVLNNEDDGNDDDGDKNNDDAVSGSQAFGDPGQSNPAPQPFPRSRWYSNHNSRPRRRYRVMPTDPPVISTTPDGDGSTAFPANPVGDASTAILNCAMDSVARLTNGTVGNVKELLKIFSTNSPDEALIKVLTITIHNLNKDDLTAIKDSIGHSLKSLHSLTSGVGSL